MLLKDLLLKKGKNVFTVGPMAPLTKAIEKLADNNCGSLVVCREEEVLGIITERDILRAEASNEDPLETLTVEDVMGCCEVICHLEDTLDEAISVMAEHQIRYLPIVQEKKLLGLVSMGDLLRARFSLKEIKSPQLSPHFSLNQSTNPSVPR